MVYGPDVDPAGMTEFDTPEDYLCQDGHYFTDRRFKAREQLMCRAGNIWEGELGECHKSESIKAPCFPPIRN